MGLMMLAAKHSLLGPMLPPKIHSSTTIDLLNQTQSQYPPISLPSSPTDIPASLLTCSLSAFLWAIPPPPLAMLQTLTVTLSGAVDATTRCLTDQRTMTWCAERSPSLVRLAVLHTRGLSTLPIMRCAVRVQHRVKSA